MTIVAMILVNTPGSWDHVYPQLLHAVWVGCTFTDLIFPFFLFVAGVAMWFSLKRARISSPHIVRGKILRRAGLIFLVGLLLTWFPFYDIDLDALKFAGVLQRIAVSYLIASLVCLSLRRTGVAIVSALLLVAYWGLILWIGKDQPYIKDGVFERGIDFTVFTSCLSSATPIMIGYLVGGYIDRPQRRMSMHLTMLGIGIAMTLLGKLWSLEFPIIKSLFWSSSYVVYSVGIALATFSACMLIIDRQGIKAWATPFLWFGVNPLFLYAISILLDKLTWMIRIGDGDSSVSLHVWTYETLFQPLAGPINGSLLYAVCFVALHFPIAWWLYRRRVIVKI